MWLPKAHAGHCSEWHPTACAAGPMGYEVAVVLCFLLLVLAPPCGYPKHMRATGVSGIQPNVLALPCGYPKASGACVLSLKPEFANFEP